MLEICELFGFIFIVCVGVFIHLYGMCAEMLSSLF